MVKIVDADHYILSLGQLVSACIHCNPQSPDRYINRIHERWTTRQLTQFDTMQAYENQLLDLDWRNAPSKALRNNQNAAVHTRLCILVIDAALDHKPVQTKYQLRLFEGVNGKNSHQQQM